MKSTYSVVLLLAGLLLSFTQPNLKAQTQQKTISLETDTGTLDGTLLLPRSLHKNTVALLISGSGPTDRDGNNPMMKNNSLKMVAEELSGSGIASVRYDKRGIGKSATAGKDESELRFEDYINDAVAWVNKLKQDERFDHVIIIGHSEGSLIGMVAADQSSADAFISLAGFADSLDDIIRTQLKSQPAFVLEQATPILDSLSAGHQVSNVPPALYSLFRESVQPYLISMFSYTPSETITELEIPILIVQGTHDIQIETEQAEKLNEAAESSEMIIIDGMNHVLKQAPAERQKNIETYSDPNLALNPELMPALTNFIKQSVTE
jgi:pimeloyl-ACP methyl ester carboxylesterase